VVGALGLLALLLIALSPGSGSGRPAARPTSSAGQAEVRCSVAYAVVGEWPDGFQAQVRVTNLGDAPVDGWRLAWSFPNGQKVVQLWNGGPRQQGSDVEVTAADWNRTIPPRGTVEFGFLGRQDGGNKRPDGFTLNGQGCSSTP
jgi:serine/threonine-protein kinase